MAIEEPQRIRQLCAQIAKEEDPLRFRTLIRELNDLLDEKRGRLLEKPSTPASAK
jgi:hypothetical protein